MNKLLSRQVNKYLGDTPVSPDLQALLHAISESYDHHERDRKLLERSLEINSIEMREMNSALRKDAEEGTKAIYQQLKESLSLINEDDEQIIPPDLDYRKLSQIAEILKNETRKRRIAEKDMNQRTKHLEASQKIAHIGSWEMDVFAENGNLDFKSLHWSDETYRIMGFKPGAVKVTGELFFQCVPKEERETIVEGLKNAIETGGIYNNEHTIITKANASKLVHAQAEIVKDSTNAPEHVKMIGTLRDITAEKKAEAQLKKANYELKTLFDNMQECAFTVDMEANKLIQIGPSCKDIYGYSVSEFMRNPNLWIEVVVEEDLAGIWAKNATLEKGESIVNTYKIKDKRGKLRWLQSKLNPTLKDGKLVRLDGITADITKQKITEIELKNSEFRFRSLIENSADALMILNKNSEALYVSDSVSRLMGYTTEELLGKSSFDFFHPDDMPMIQQHVKKVHQNPSKTFDLEYRRRKKDGSYIWCEGSATNLLHVDSVNGIVVNFRDITERKKSEKALQASNEDLKKSNNELDKFVYSVSHDLRAPLSSMLGVVSLIESETTDESIAGDINLLKNSINKLDGFINDILDYSRNTRMLVVPEEIDFEQNLTDVSNNLKHMASAHNKVEIKTCIDCKTSFYSDRTRLSIILNNLVSNAMRYSDPKKEHPFVEVHIKTSQDGAVIIIKDNGVGISKENSGKIFDMFYRVSKKSVGSGLGLYIVKDTVEKLNGKILMESELGKGTQFTISIPNLKHI